MSIYIVGASIGGALNRFELDGRKCSLFQIISRGDDLLFDSFEVDDKLKALLEEFVATDTQLDVEAAGRIVVRLSTLGDYQGRNDSWEKILRACMTAGVSNGGQIPSTAKVKILENTSVKIQFDALAEDSEQGPNTRHVTIPAPTALEDRLEGFAENDQPISPNTRPAQMYEVDDSIMLAYLANDFVSLAKDAATGLIAEEDLAEFATKLRQSIAAKANPAAGTTPSTEDRIGKIMNSNSRAFLRSVGIYSTSMCR